MTMPQFHTLPDGRRLAYRHTPGTAPDPVLVFLPGYKSDMAGGKAVALFDQALATGRGCLLLDYAGCGLSDGRFADGTLSRWRDEVLALVDAICPGRPLLLAGSSMGGWLMLLVALARPHQVRGLLGIAAAPDFTEWGYDAAQQALLATGEVLYEDNPYGSEPTPTHPGFWRDGQANRVLGAPIAFAGPVHLLHGQRDADVPWEVALRLAAALRSDAVQVTLVKDGDHRLSRDPDLALLLRTAEALRAKL
ncbi:alpha/beta hydrolase [Novosphingobium piscinae]|uniref:Alpha/beta hydrolase n=1 Tax=Novosphingobium piscinae TaxID=1507448 RepID=A0A7X1KR18_9SPHN|nr:alpha/beta hydrolase [Novosphingobium piscinae]MBC2670319.1 alpha/beta hydrolase [Novosphingobium piscinae]